MIAKEHDFAFHIAVTSHFFQGTDSSESPRLAHIPATFTTQRIPVLGIPAAIRQRVRSKTPRYRIEYLEEATAEI